VSSVQCKFETQYSDQSLNNSQEIKHTTAHLKLVTGWAS